MPLCSRSTAGGGCAADLPCGVIQHVLRLRYPRRIPGTYGVAAVCSTWHDAIPASDPLDLLINLDELRDQEQLQRVASWLQAYPDAVRCLHIRYAPNDDRVQPNGFTLSLGLTALLSALQQGLGDVPAAAMPHRPTAHQLTSLCLDGSSSLLQVEPLLPQLLQLQHLEAGLCIAAYAEDGSQLGFCTNDWQPLQQLPDVSMAAALTSFQLNLKNKLHGFFDMDVRLPQLLPSTLRRLHIVVEGFSVHTGAAQLTHLTNLQVLTLIGHELVNAAALLSLPQLQQVALSGAEREALAPLLISAAFGFGYNWRRHATALTALTSLRILPYRGSAAPVLRQLPSLLDLYLGKPLGSHDVVESWLASAAAVQQLQALMLCWDDARPPQDAAAAAALAGCTQLTSLQLKMGCLYVDPVPWAAALSSLVGLQQLSVNATLLEVQQQWLQPLAALQRLVIRLPARVSPSALLQQLQCAAPSLEVLVLMGSVGTT